MSPVNSQHHDVPPGRGGGLLVHRAEWLRALELVQELRLGAGVVHIDLDRFHQVNSRWGQSVGDRVLALLGPRLAEHLPRDARLVVEGDSFNVVLPAVDAGTTRRIAESLLEVIRVPVAVDQVLVSVGASAGIAWQAPDEEPIDVVEQAFLACRRAKATALGSVVGYEGALGDEMVRRQRLEDELRTALTDHQFRLVVQPKVDLGDGVVTGVEALLRWQHPIDGLLAPASFLAEAETAGMMVAIGDWVLEEAIALASRWRRHRRGERPVRVWVNLAAQQLSDGDRVVDRIRSAIDEGLVSAQCIGFEVTESSLLDDLPSAVGMLGALRELGIEIALDDFGTGYSSLSYLRRLPVTAVKIDRQFVAGIGGSLADEAIVEAVIDLSHALGLRVVAEGIEDVAQAEALRRMGADQAQGFLFGQPAPADEIEPRLALAWCGVTDAAPVTDADAERFVDRRADELPGYGSPRARLLLAALDSATDSVIVTAAAGGDRTGPPIVYVNPAFEAETGYRSRNVIGRTVGFLLADPTDDAAIRWFEEVHAARHGATTEMGNRRADGTAFLCETTLSPISDERGVHTHWLHVRRDLTQRRSAEGDRAKFEGLVEQSTALVYLADETGRLVYANAALRRAAGIRPDEPLAEWTTRRMLSDDEDERIRREVLPLLERTGLWSGEGYLVSELTGERAELVTDVQRVADPLRPGRFFFASVSRDVSEVNALSRAAQRRQRLRNFSAGLARRALELDEAEEVDGIAAVLGALGELLAADLVYFDAIDTDAEVLRPVGRWTSERYGSHSELPVEIPLEKLPRWVEHLQQGGVASGSAHAEPWAAELGSVFEGAATGVDLVASLRVGGRLLGVIGIADVDPDRQWTDDEVDTVQEVADTLANLFARRRAADALRAGEARLAAMLANVSDVLVVVDRDGWIRYVNPRVEQVLGRAAADVVGHHFLDFVHDDDRALAIDRFTESVAGRTDLPPTEIRVWTADGDPVWFGVDISTAVDPLVGGYMVSLRNVTQQRAVLEAADRRVEHERVVLALSRWALEVEPDDIIDGLHVHLGLLGQALGTDTAFACLLDGDRVRNVAGWSATRADTRGFEFPIGEAVPAIVTRYRTLEPLVVDDIDDIDDETEPWAREWRSFPVPDRSGLNVPLVSEGRCLGNLGVAMHTVPRQWTADEIALVRKVSETVSALLVRHQVEASLRLSEVRLASLLDLAQTALDLDHATFLAELPEICAGIAEMLGVDFVYVDQLDEARGELVNLAAWTGPDVPVGLPRGGRVPFGAIPDWVARLRRATPIAERDARTCTEPWARDKQAFAGQEGGVMAVAMSSAGELFGVLGVSMADQARDWSTDEVTFVRIAAETIAHVLERARLDEALRASEARFRSLSETAADLVLLISTDGVIVYASPSSVDLLGCTPDELIGRAARTLTHPDHPDITSVAPDPMTGKWSTESLLVRADGSTVWVANSMAAVIDPATGAATEYRVSMRDISDRKRLEAELERQALHDPLTGLANRFLLQSRLEVATARRGHHHQVAVLMADLDGFKEINDTHGHAAGDEVLRIVAARLQRLTRPMDTVARTGGDEFVLLCPETDEAAAVRIAERLVEAIRLPVAVEGVMVRLGVSVGVAHHRGELADADWLLIEADHAMYASKRSGRGRVSVAPARPAGGSAVLG